LDPFPGSSKSAPKTVPLLLSTGAQRFSAVPPPFLSPPLSHLRVNSFPFYFFLGAVTHSLFVPHVLDYWSFFFAPPGGTQYFFPFFLHIFSLLTNKVNLSFSPPVLPTPTFLFLNGPLFFFPLKTPHPTGFPLLSGHVDRSHSFFCFSFFLPATTFKSPPPQIVSTQLHIVLSAASLFDHLFTRCALSSPPSFRPPPMSVISAPQPSHPFFTGSKVCPLPWSQVFQRFFLMSFFPPVVPTLIFFFVFRL